MRLELGTFPVHTITFGSQTRYQDGHLEVDKAAVLEAVQHDPVLRLSTWRLPVLGSRCASGPCVMSLNHASRSRGPASRILVSVVGPLRP